MQVRHSPPHALISQLLIPHDLSPCPCLLPHPARGSSQAICAFVVLLPGSFRCSFPHSVEASAAASFTAWKGWTAGHTLRRPSWGVSARVPRHRCPLKYIHTIADCSEPNRVYHYQRQQAAGRLWTLGHDLPFLLLQYSL